MKLKIAILAIFTNLTLNCLAFNPPAPAGAANSQTASFGFETPPDLDPFGNWVDVTNAAVATGAGAWLPSGATYKDPFGFPDEDDPNVGLQG